ncbi:hypothetical protein ACFOOM_01000 [Streptomyces echinoruber]|uniref:Uncharacterized protein n=1 Tax=Streptomyces echinoruber TaxID=68898 RepID=A0A918QYM1_9ACTN|nr:hypothetical protein [Streptomyces echinoruber]GGZ73172.1 hypothetical protein GCM10010389_08340 [Streptomyces echinoruber]
MQHLTATRVLIPGVIGPYDAHVELADDWNGHVRPLFSLTIVRQIAADTQAQAGEYGHDNVITAHVIDGDPGRDGEHRAVVLVVNWQWWDQDGGARKVTDIVEPTSYGLYAIGGDSWCWEFQTWDCRCEEKNPWHVTVCQCGQPRAMQVAVPKGMKATRVGVDGLGSYPAFVVEHARLGQLVAPHFTLDTVRQLADDTQKAAAQYDPRSAETIHVLDAAPAPDGTRRSIVLHTDWCIEVDDGPADAVRVVAPDQFGLYPVAPDWHWRITTWSCVCGNANAWDDDQCHACTLTRAGQPKTDLEAAAWKVGRLLRAQAPEATSALIDLTELAHITAVYAGIDEISTADDGPFDTETLGTADAEIQQALEKAAIGDLTNAGWEPVLPSRYLITFGRQ